MAVQSEKSVDFGIGKLILKLILRHGVASWSLNMKLRELKKEFYMRMILGMSTTKWWICMNMVYVRIERKRQEKMLPTQNEV